MVDARCSSLCWPWNLWCTGLSIIGVFLNTEQFFAGLVGGDETQIKAKFVGEPQQLLELLIAHDALKSSLELIASVLRCLAALPRGATFFLEVLTQSLQGLAELPSEGGCGEVQLLSWQILNLSQERSQNECKEEVRAMLASMSRNECADVAQHSRLFQPPQPTERTRTRTASNFKPPSRTGGQYTGMDVLSLWTLETVRLWWQ